MAKVQTNTEEATAERATIPVPELGSEGPGSPVPPAAAPAGEEPLRRRRGRPRKGETPAPVEPVVSKEDMERTTAALAMSFKALGTVLRSRRGEHWQFTDEECGTLGGAWAAAIAPYLPRVGKAVPWVSAAVITWTVVSPRVEEDGRRARERKLSAPKLEVVSEERKP